MTLLRAVVFGALGALWGFALWAWPRLPQTVPVHFGADGAPDRWASASPTSWFALPVVALLLNVIMIVATRWLAAGPERVKLAGGATAADLPAAQRDRVVGVTIGTLLLVQGFTNLVFLIIQWAQFRSAQGADSSGLIQAVLLSGLLSGPVLIVAHFLRLRKAVESLRSSR